MAKSVVGLNIKIGANIATLQRDLNLAKAALSNFGASAGGAAGGVNALGRANAALTSGIGRVTGFLKSQVTSLVAIGVGMAAATVSVRGLTSAFKDIEDIANLADRIGATTESIVGLRKAAILGGSSAESMDAALKKMTRTVGAAIGGNKQAVQSFRGLGISIEQLTTADPGEQIRLIAEGINRLGTQAEKEAAAVRIFGKAGGEMLTVLAGGREGFDAIQKAVEASGEAFDKFSGDKVRAANDAMDNMKAAFTGVARSAAITLAPAVESAAKAIVSMIQSVRNLDATTVRNTLTLGTFALGFAGVVAIIPRVLSGIAATVAALRTLAVAGTLAQAATGVGLVTALAGLAVGAIAANEVGKAFDQMTDSIDAATTATKQYNEATLKQLAISGTKIQKAFAVAELEAIEKAKKASEGLKDDLESSAGAMEDYEEKWAKIGESIAESVATPAEKLKAKLAEIREAFAGGFIDKETATRAIIEARDELDKLGKARDAFRSSPAVGAAVAGTAGGAAAVADGQRALKDMAEATKRRELSDKKREKLLEEIRKELVEIKKKTEPPKVKEHAIV